MYANIHMEKKMCTFVSSTCVAEKRKCKYMHISANIHTKIYIHLCGVKQHLRNSREKESAGERGSRWGDVGDRERVCVSVSVGHTTCSVHAKKWCDHIPYSEA